MVVGYSVYSEDKNNVEKCYFSFFLNMCILILLYQQYIYANYQIVWTSAARQLLRHDSALI